MRVPKQNAAKIFFRIGYAGSELFLIDSHPFPLFNGNVYSVMLRRNAPSSEYEFNSSIDSVPCRYDLYVQQNESGNRIVYLTSSNVCYDASINRLFDVSPTSSYIMLGGWFADLNGHGFTGAMDKWQMWYDSITDSNFEDYVNHINSYSFTGSRLSDQSLLFRMHTDYPFDLRQIASGSVIPSGFAGFSGFGIRLVWSVEKCKYILCCKFIHETK